MTPPLRLVLAVTGLVAGFAYYLIFDEQVLAGTPVWAHRLAIYGSLGVFPALGLMAGPLTPARAAPAALGVALAAALLAVWAGTRFGPPSGLEDLAEPSQQGMIVVPFLGLLLLAVPFAIAAGQAPGGWRRYGLVFDAAWACLVRGLVASAFLGLFWFVYFLSDALLQLANIDVLDRFLRVDWVPYALSGLVLGLALAVTAEMTGVILTLRGLILRLLRLFMVPVTAVMAVFLAAAVVQGIDGVFEQFSAALTMMLMAAGGVVLIAAVLGHGDDEMATTPMLLWSVRTLAALLPLVAAIAVYAIWVRVGQYGLTPPRIMALVVAVLVAVFALAAALFAVSARAGWAGRVRGGFLGAALITGAVAAIWQTPVLNAQSIATRDQLARILAGRVDPADYDFWPMVREWGTAGQAAADRIRTDDTLSGAATLHAAIDRARSAENRWQSAEAVQATGAAEDWGRLRTAIRVVPDGTPLPERLDAEWRNARFVVRILVRDCLETAEDQPPCAAIFADFRPDVPGEEAMILALADEGQRLSAQLLVPLSDGAWGLEWVSTPAVDNPATAFAALLAGEAEVVPLPLNGLRLGEVAFFPDVATPEAYQVVPLGPETRE